MHSSYPIVLLAPLALARPQYQSATTLLPVQPSPTQTGAYPANPSASGVWYQEIDEQEDPSEPVATDAYYCKGPLAADYPSIDQWRSFDTLWKINEAEAKRANSDEANVPILKEAIKKISKESKIDARIILTIVMEESTGQVDIGCPEGPCGLMQIQNATNFDPQDPQGSIEQQLKDGLNGVDGWPGYATIFNGQAQAYPFDAWPGWRGNPYTSAKMYNGGIVKNEDLTLAVEGRDETIWYVNDFASRLLGSDGLVDSCEASRECKFGPDQKKLFSAKDCSLQGAQAK